MSKITKPNIRFSEYTDEWEECKLSEGLTEYTDRVFIEDNKKYKQISVKNIGKISVRGEKIGADIGRKRQAKINLKDHPNTLIFTRQTIEQGGIGIAPKEVDNAIVTENMPTIDVNNEIIDCRYLLSYTKTQKWYKNVILKNIEGGTAQVAIHEDDILTSSVLMPQIVEQQKIGIFFEKLDDTIDLHQRELGSFKTMKKSLLNKMFPKNGESVPEIRFPGFTDAWKQRKLGDLGSVAMNKRIFKDQTSEHGEIPFFKIGTFGSTPDAFISRELFEEYKEKYPYPEIGDILISASGSIGRTVVYQGKDEYFQDSNIVWLKHDNQLDNKFLNQFYSIVKWQGLEGSTIKRLYNKNILDTVINIPNVEEQSKIGSFFEKLDDTIALHQRELDTLEEMKKTLLKEMFI